MASNLRYPEVYAKLVKRSLQADKHDLDARLFEVAAYAIKQLSEELSAAQARITELEKEVAVICDHTLTQGREGQTGSWCNACGAKIYDVDDRECQDCDSSRKLINGWICKKHLMAVSPDMHVTFKISEGSCWTPRAEADPPATPGAA